MSYQPPFYKQLFHSSRRTLAKYWLSFMPALQIAITGSQGKTNTSRVITEILSLIGPTVRTDTNLDTIYNVPITALKVNPWTKFAVFELGIDHPNEMDLHLQIVKPKIGIITGISPVHTDKEHLGSLENLIKEKRKLIEALPRSGFAILNYDDKNVRDMGTSTKAKILWYGTERTNCDVWVDSESVHLSLSGTEFKLSSANTKEPITIRTGLIGKHHIYTIMSALLVFQAAQTFVNTNVSINQLIETFKDLKPLEGRMSVEPGPLETMILSDSLRANPSSTAAGLETLSQIEYTGGKKIAILAEMGELQNPKEEHIKIGKLLGDLNVDIIIGIGPMQKFVIEEALHCGLSKNNVFFAQDVYNAANFLKKVLHKGDLIYLKGSLYRHVERVLMILEGKKPPNDLILEVSKVE